MTPFILWLDKSEVDTLLGNILRSNNEVINDELMNQDQLVELAQRLLDQNNDLIHLFKKVQPFDKMQQNIANIYGVQQKCNYYKETKSKMKAHCSMHKNDLCNDCPH